MAPLIMIHVITDTNLLCPRLQLFFEKFINSKLLDYFENYDLLTSNQSAFRKHQFTLTASHKL